MKQQSVLSKGAPPDSACAWIQEANIKKYLAVYSNIGVHVGLHSPEVFITSYTYKFTGKLYISYTITDFSLHIVHDILPCNSVEEAFQVLFIHKI